MNLNLVHNLFELFAGIGLFLLGVKVLSTYQQVVFDKQILRVLRKNGEASLDNLWRGVVISLLSCSRSTATITIIGLINAGLIKLGPGVRLILGANCGAAMMILFVAILSPDTYPLFLGAGCVLFFIGKLNGLKNWGMILFGLGIILLGHQLLNNSWVSLASQSGFRQFQQFFMSVGVFRAWFAFLISIFVGFFFRSSFVGVGLGMSLGFAGMINFSNGIFWVMGANVGASIGTLVFAKEGNMRSRRASVFHFLTIFIGAIIAGIIMSLYGQRIEAFPVNDLDLPLGLVHIAFNFGISLFFFLLCEQVLSIAAWWIPEEEMEQQCELEVLGRPTDMIPAMALILARIHMAKLKDVVDRQFKLTREYVMADEASPRILAKIKDYERVTDNMRSELTEFLGSLIENLLSPLQAKDVQSLIRVAVDFEDIGDYLDKLATYATRLKTEGEMAEKTRSEFLAFFEEVEDFYFVISNQIKMGVFLQMEQVNQKAKTLKVSAEGMRSRHLERISKGEYGPLGLMTYSDMVVCLRKIRGHTLRIFHSLNSLS